MLMSRLNDLFELPARCELPGRFGGFLAHAKVGQREEVTEKRSLRNDKSDRVVARLTCVRDIQSTREASG